MVPTGGEASFAEDFPLFHALSSRDDALVARLLHEQPQLATEYGPGGFSALHACALLGSPQPVAALVAAGAPLDGRLGVDGDALYKWLTAGQLVAADDTRASRPLVQWRTPLAVAAALHHVEVALALVRAGADLAAGLLEGVLLLPDTALAVVPHLVQRFDEGRLAIASSSQLDRMVQLVGGQGQLDVCLRVLRAAAQRQLSPGAHVRTWALGLAAKSGHAQLARQLLASWTPDPHYCHTWAVTAIAGGHAEVLEALLDAGAPVDVQLARAVVRSQQPECLRMLLRRGPLPVDTSSLYIMEPNIFYVKRLQYTCPVVETLRLNAQEGRPSQALPVLEALLAAGHRPTVYNNVAPFPGGESATEFDPLKLREWDFAFDTTNKYLRLALQSEGWGPATHAAHPPALREAFRAVLLAAARGDRQGARQGASSGSEGAPSCKTESPSKRTRGKGGEGSGEGARLLASLPQDLLLHILELAARPLSAWV